MPPSRGFSALVFGRSLVCSIPMRFSLLVGWLFFFSGFLPLRILLGFPVVVLLWEFMPLLSCSWVYLWSLGASLPRSNLRFPRRRSPPFGPSQLPFGFLLLLVSLSCACLLASLRWSPSASPLSPPTVLVLFPSGSFLLRGPCYSSSVGFPSGVRSQCLIGPSVVFPSSVPTWSFFCSLLGFHFLPVVPP